MRARNIKPGFFVNEDIGELKYEERILFIGLWCLCDREGFFELRLKKIAIEIFPYDRSIDEEKIDKMLCNLMSLHLITCHDMYGHVINFSTHQRPHPHEAQSKVPDDIKKILKNQCHDMSLHVTKCPSDIRNDDIRNEENLHPDGDEKKPPPLLYFGEFKNVKMKQEEYNKLVERFGKKSADDKIQTLSIGIKSHGYKYKSHYATILSWDRKDKRENSDDFIPDPTDDPFYCKICKKKKSTMSGRKNICKDCE